MLGNVINARCVQVPSCDQWCGTDGSETIDGEGNQGLGNGGELLPMVGKMAEEVMGI